MRVVRWILAVVAVLAAFPASAVGHAGFRAADPRPGAQLTSPPAEVRVALSAPVEHAFARLEVDGPDGRRRSGRAGPDPDDPQAIQAPLAAAGAGVYVVRWRAFSGDGHVTSGEYTFRVGRGIEGGPAVARSGADDDGALAVAARLLVLAGPLGLVGMVVVRFGVVGLAWRRGAPRPPGTAADPDEEAAGAAALHAAAGTWWRGWWALTGAWAAGLVLLAVAVPSALDEGPGALGTLLSETRWGAAWVVQAAALALAAVAAGALHRGAGGRDPAPPMGWAVALGLPPAAALVAVSWSGHASSGTDRSLGIAIDAAHNVATGAWLGGLLALATLLAPAARRLGGAARVRLMAGAVVRFSSLAVGSVAVLVVTGVYRALAELRTLDDLVDTGYGRALAVKLGVFAVMLAVGGWNRLVLHPRLERAALGLEPGDHGAADALRRSVRAELVLAAGVMVAVGLLTSLPPPV